MPLSRALPLFLATLSLLAATVAHAAIGIEPIPDQDIPSGKTLVVPIPASDPAGPARTYTITVGAPTVSGSASVSATAAGITAAIRTGDPHFMAVVSYTDSNSVAQTGTMEFQLLREFAPTTTQIIGGLVQGGYYSPQSNGTNGLTYLKFDRVIPGFVVQLGSPSGDGRGGPGFTFENEFSNALIFSGSLGQLAMANGGTNVNGGTNGSQFFITLAAQRSLDYKHTNFGQLVRGFNTLNGVANTPIDFSTPVDLGGGQTEFSKPLHPVNITSATVTQNDTDAVLLLSATGVCDSVITVTASSGGTTTTQSFTAHAITDTTSDPPFLRPVLDMTVPNGLAKVALQGIDLQLDLLRYGYQRVLPVGDNSITSGTSPLISIPLISNTDNEIVATLDHWNPSTRGNDERIFHVGAGEKPLRGALTPIPPGRFNSLVLANPNTVAVFTAGNPNDSAAGFTTSVNWGDGTYLSGSNVTVVKDTTARTVNRFKVMAGHIYTNPGEYPVIVKIADPGGARLTLTGTASVAPAAIAISGMEIYKTKGVLNNQLLATLEDSGATSTATDYTATIDWGDGSVTPGTVKGSASSYKILGSHTYKTSDTFTVSTSVTRTGSNGYSANTWAAAHIAGIAAPQVFPPFPQAHLAQIWTAILTDSNTITTTGTNGGGNPYAGLIQAMDGNLYGTTEAGGSSNNGTVYQLTTTGSETTLYNFADGSDGANPYAALMQGLDGNLYGTAEAGGLNGTGTVYQITTGGALTPLYGFSALTSGTNTDGANPFGGLIQTTDSNLYGTTEAGGPGGAGTVFQITTSGTLTTLHAFTSGTDGGNPFSGLISATNGNLYGTTEAGGTGGAGTVFQITTSGSLTTLHAFTSGTDGGNPFGGLVQGMDGNLYGTTEAGGSGSGTIFQITTSGSLTTLYSFTGGNDGANPYGKLVQAANGNLYGTTKQGGSSGTGTVFQITTSGGFTSLYSFPAGSGGQNPVAGLVQANDTNLYGTTVNGGANGFGTAYQITTGGAFTSLYSFNSGVSGQTAFRGAVAIVNSGNVSSAPGSFSAYLDPNGAVDGQATLLISAGQSAFPIPALKPGQYVIFSFRLEGTVVDTRLKPPVGFNSEGQELLGVVTYNDPVANFDGSQKVIVLPGTF